MMHCQFAGAALCASPAVYVITNRSATGFVWVESHCRAHVGVRADQLVRDGAKIIKAHELPEPPQIVLQPVGLDAIDQPRTVAAAGGAH